MMKKQTPTRPNPLLIAYVRAYLAAIKLRFAVLEAQGAQGSQGASRRKRRTKR